jgi:ribosomal protein S27E
VNFALDLLHTEREVPCPQCEYPIWVLWSEIVAQTTIRCPCCRRRVRLVDATGSIQNIGADIDAQLRRIFGGLSR